MTVQYYLLFMIGAILLTVTLALCVVYRIYKRYKMVLAIVDVCDLSDTSENEVYFRSCGTYIAKKEFKKIIDLIFWDGYNIDGFKLLEIPHECVFCFGNPDKDQYFDVVKFKDDKWQFSYCDDCTNKVAYSIDESIKKYKWAQE